VTRNFIKNVHGRKVRDSRGYPAIEVDIELRYGARGRASVPFGRSFANSKFIATQDRHFSLIGLEIENALHFIYEKIMPSLKGLDVRNQAQIDSLLIGLDKTVYPEHIPKNAVVAASMAVTHAAAAAEKLPLWQYLGALLGLSNADTLPLPQVQIFGRARDTPQVDIKGFMITAIGASSYAEALEWSAKVHHHALVMMLKTDRLRGVPDHGDFGPTFKNNEDGLEMVLRAIESAKLKPGEDVAIALDVSASEFGENGQYRLAQAPRTLESDELSGMLVDWVERYPIVSVENPLGNDDEEGLARFTWAVGKRVQVVGDHLLNTRVNRALNIEPKKVCNAVLIDPNKLGTVTASLTALKTIQKCGFGAIISGSYGETEDTTILHLGVGWGVSQLKFRSFGRSERMIMWNEGLRVAEAISLSDETLPRDGNLPPKKHFPWAR